MLRFFLYRTRLVVASIFLISFVWGWISQTYSFISDATYLILLNFWLVVITASFNYLLRTFVKGNNFERYGTIVILIFILAITFTLNPALKFLSKKYPFPFSAIGMISLLNVLYLSFQLYRPVDIWPRNAIRFLKKPKYKFTEQHLQIFLIGAGYLFFEGLIVLSPYQGFIISWLVLIIIHLTALYFLRQIYWIPTAPIGVWKDAESRYTKTNDFMLSSDRLLGYSIGRINYEIDRDLNLEQTKSSLNQLMQFATHDMIHPEVFWRELDRLNGILISDPFSMDNLAFAKILINSARRWGFQGTPAKKYILLVLPPLLKRYRIFALLPKYLQDTVYEMFELFHLLGIGNELWESIIDYEITTRRYAKMKLPILSGAPVRQSWRFEWNYRLFFGEEGKKLVEQDLEKFRQISAKRNYMSDNLTERNSWEKDLEIAAIHLFSTFFGQNSRMPWGGSVRYPYEEYDWVRRGYLLDDFSEEAYRSILPPVRTKTGQQKEKTAKVPKAYQKHYIEAYLNEGKVLQLPEKSNRKQPRNWEVKKLFAVFLFFVFALTVNLGLHHPAVAATFGVLGISMLIFSIEDIQVRKILENTIPITNEFELQPKTFEINLFLFSIGLLWSIIGAAFLI